jgi:hypothetical protein
MDLYDTTHFHFDRMGIHCKMEKKDNHFAQMDEVLSAIFHFA